MKKNLYRWMTGLSLMLVWVLSSAAQTAPTKNLWPAVTKETKPWSRWWWMGSAIDDKNLSLRLKEYALAGFGGMEITPIYGAVGYEKQYISFLSPEWMRLLDVTVREASKSGMGIDMNTGTGWPFGGPQIEPSNSASRWVINRYELKEGERIKGKLMPTDPRQVGSGAQIQVVTAYGPDGQAIVLTDKLSPDGSLNWQADKGNWEVVALFSGHTLQMVKRAAPGGEGLVFDHFSGKALKQYLTRFDDAFGRSNHGIGSFFNDSYELFGTNWTPELPKEFLQKRG
ncbi:MAG: hypothetical protein LWW85_05925, partial [Marinilabiliales bacterium]|nr:hypothetical protein [Marinilabiliales bacterium]